MSNNQKAFLELVKAGLWEKNVELKKYGVLDFSELMRLAIEQSVVGLVTVGVDFVSDVKIPQEWALQFIGHTLKIEQRNRAMNLFIAQAVQMMHERGIRGLLVKGSGVAQYYEKPLWRFCGDIDFLFQKDDYQNAVELFSKIEGAKLIQNARYTKSFGVIVDPWIVEVHGTLRNGLSSKMDREIDDVQQVLFTEDHVRKCIIDTTPVLTPAPNEDVFLLFVHLVRHFYKGGVNIRQICDWCRMLWTCQNQIDSTWLEKHLLRANVMEEWMAFAALAVKYLGMPTERVPLYDVNDGKWKNKEERVSNYILGKNGATRVMGGFDKLKIFPRKTLFYTPIIWVNFNLMKVREAIFKNDYYR